MTTFRVGMRVVCVNAKGCPELEKGQVYTVKSVYVDEITRLGAVTLEEAYPVPRAAFEGFYANRFRPVAYPKQSAEQDAELFQPLLSPDPLDIATLYERDFADTEARLERLWTAMRSFEL